MWYSISALQSIENGRHNEAPPVASTVHISILAVSRKWKGGLKHLIWFSMSSVGNPEFSSWGWEISARISCIVINLYMIYYIHISILTHLRVIQSSASYATWLVIHIVETNNDRLTIMKAATFYRILIFLLLNSSLCMVFTLQVSGSIWVYQPQKSELEEANTSVHDFKLECLEQRLTQPLFHHFLIFFI